MTNESENLAGNWGSRNRPSTLEDYCGQKDAKAKVAGMLADKKIPSLIGIVGATGWGKTTLARIIARFLTKYPESDIIERDMGSNGSIDDIRELSKLARYHPKGKYRVFIIDEFHLVSKQASSVLLKLMEEPPPKTIFIWCTDQESKVLPSLRGRTFFIRLVEEEPSVIVPYLSKVCKAEGFKFKSIEQKKAVLKRISEMCGGQPRSSVNKLQELYMAVKGKGKLKDALEQALTDIENLAPDLVSLKLLLAMYTSGSSTKTAKVVYDYTGGDWRSFINALLLLNSILMKYKTGAKTSTWGGAKLLINKIDERVGLKKVPLEKICMVQNNLLDITKDMVQGVSENYLIPARLVAISCKAAR